MTETFLSSKVVSVVSAMKRQREGMQVNVAGLRRNIMNLAHNYSGAQVKVREATSNDPWGPSSTLMSEIADLTYNVVAFTEIMQMVWKRLNDHGRNWRHVYKALVLLDYLIKTGSEKVAQQCKENIFAIQTLRDFQYVEEGKDQGINVREKAKQLVLLLKDEERLRNERARALKAKERFAQTASGFGSDTGLDSVSPSSPGFPSYRDAWGSGEESTPTSRVAAVEAPELECARPQTVGEEELQLQLALAMSREEAQQEEQKRRSDDVRLQLALSQSENEFKHKVPSKDLDMPSSHMLDLLDVNLGAASPPPAPLDPWGMPSSQPPPPRPQTLDIMYTNWDLTDPWSVTTNSTPSVNDPWTPASTSSQPLPPKPDPWRAVDPPTPVPPKPPMNDPWSPASPALSVSPPPQSNGTNLTYNSGTNIASTPLSDLDEFDQILNRDRNINSVNNNITGTISPDPFDLTGLTNSLTPSPSNVPPPKKTPQSFLGENSALVNLENLVTKTSLTSAPAVPTPPALANPFSNSPTMVRPPIRTPPYPPAVQAPLLPQPNPFLS
ncbi:epsin-1-like isoform X2 [Macrosteles quadrilineatus]|uniref:epsin-1-like isoform X2 n=1 Tax=Macrosteles quadrilineatus TaxID=74068 RepID=UPI0023E33231|nr:epsin-1-like isoform X2 [Macrosteles quadrilineatus]